jgi:Mor family transcriptional regulator
LEKEHVLDNLEKNIGTEATDLLVAMYGGSNLYIPKCRDIRKKRRRIKEEFNNGASYKELARRYGYTERHIRRIVHKKTKSGKITHAINLGKV